MNGPFIAVDWGTSNRRAYRLEQGRASQVTRDARGVRHTAPADFAPEADALRHALGDLPMLCVGMVGSRRGWREVPYVNTPADLPALAAATLWIEPGRTAIAPGVSHRSAARSDVMRGEEVQLLGAVAAGLAPEGALLCQPGTHCKWARVQGGRITEFRTALTGELFALLREHSLLQEVLTGEVVAAEAFREGVREGTRQTLLTSLFGARAAHLLGDRAPTDGAAYVSGVLIGSDVQSQAAGEDTVYLIGEPPLTLLYAAALEEIGTRCRLIDSDTAFIAGANQLWSLLA